MNLGRQSALWALLLLALAALGLALGVAMGSQGWEPVWGAAADPVLQQIVWDIRLPRSLGAWLGGASLAKGGARVVAGGWATMAATYGIGSLFHVSAAG